MKPRQNRFSRLFPFRPFGERAWNLVFLFFFALPSTSPHMLKHIGSSWNQCSPFPITLNPPFRALIICPKLLLSLIVIFSLLYPPTLFLSLSVCLSLSSPFPFSPSLSRFPSAHLSFAAFRTVVNLTSTSLHSLLPPPRIMSVRKQWPLVQKQPPICFSLAPCKRSSPKRKRSKSSIPSCVPRVKVPSVRCDGWQREDGSRLEALWGCYCIFSYPFLPLLPVSFSSLLPWGVGGGGATFSLSVNASIYCSILNFCVCYPLCRWNQ